MTTLTRADLFKFFSALARRLPFSVKLALTDGSEAMLLGGRRPTGDLDFSIVTPNRRSGSFSEIEFAIASAADETRITV